MYEKEYGEAARQLGLTIHEFSQDFNVPAATGPDRLFTRMTISKDDNPPVEIYLNTQQNSVEQNSASIIKNFIQQEFDKMIKFKLYRVAVWVNKKTYAGCSVFATGTVVADNEDVAQNLMRDVLTPHGLSDEVYDITYNVTEIDLMKPRVVLVEQHDMDNRRLLEQLKYALHVDDSPSSSPARERDNGRAETT